MKPTFSQRWAVAYRGFMAAMAPSWEGWEHSRKRNRPGRRLTAQDTDLDYGVRESLLSEARSLSQIHGIVNSILNKFANYVVGSCEIQWATSDDKWNEMAEENWRVNMTMSDFQRLNHFQENTKTALRGAILDGDSFAIKVEQDTMGLLQFIEADRVGNMSGGNTNSDSNNLNGDRIIGGVRINRAGIPVSYRVNERTGYGSFVNPVDIPAPSMVHLYFPRRFESYRGVTHFHAGLNDLRDVKEIKDAEKVGVKLASKWAMVIKNSTGAPPPGLSLTDEPAGDGAVNKVDEIEDGVMQYVMNGDDVKAFASDRPSSAWQGFMVFLVREIAVGLDLPFEFVWDMASLSGPGVRMMSKQAERTFTGYQDVTERKWIVPIALWQTALDMESGRLPFNPEWTKVECDRPSHPSIDAGRESAADINEYQMGMTSGKRVVGARGGDVFKVLREKAIERRYAQDLAEEFGVPVESIIAPNPNFNPVQPPQEGQPPKPGQKPVNGEDEDE